MGSLPCLVAEPRALVSHGGVDGCRTSLAIARSEPFVETCQQCRHNTSPDCMFSNRNCPNRPRNGRYSTDTPPISPTSNSQPSSAALLTTKTKTSRSLTKRFSSLCLESPGLSCLFAGSGEKRPLCPQASEHGLSQHRLPVPPEASSLINIPTFDSAKNASY